MKGIIYCSNVIAAKETKRLCVMMCDECVNNNGGHVRVRVIFFLNTINGNLGNCCSLRYIKVSQYISSWSVLVLKCG